MIDAARAFDAKADEMMTAASDLADQVLREIERLDALRAALAAFIEQPGQVRSAPAPEGSPAPASTPAAGEGPPEPSPSPALKRGQSGSDGRRPARSESAGSTPAPRSTSLRAAVDGDQFVKALKRNGQPVPPELEGEPAAHVCGDCGQSFAKSQGLGRHRSWKHPASFEPRPDDRPHHNARRPSSGPNPIQRVEAAESASSDGRHLPAASSHHKESFVCSRCPATFKTRGWRDRHEATHPPIPDVAGTGGQRIRRTPPVNGARP